jgi:hypothetical protein
MEDGCVHGFGWWLRQTPHGQARILKPPFAHSLRMHEEPELIDIYRGMAHPIVRVRQLETGGSLTRESLNRDCVLDCLIDT